MFSHYFGLKWVGGIHLSATTTAINVSQWILKLIFYGCRKNPKYTTLDSWQEQVHLNPVDRFLGSQNTNSGFFLCFRNFVFQKQVYQVTLTHTIL